MDSVVVKIIVVLIVLALLKPVLRLLMYVALRTVFRAGLSWVGRKAMAEQPDRIHLTLAPDHEWEDQEAVAALAAPLAPLGFQEAGVYEIEELAGVVVRFLVQPEQRVAACIYEHPQAGNWIDFVCRYLDRTSVTYTTSAPTGLEERPGTQTVNAPDSSSEALYQRLLRERPAGELEEITLTGVARMFEDSYAEATAWRKNKGVSAEEVARQMELAPSEG